MITRFDHAVIAVADLDLAIEAYRALGFDVFPAGGMSIAAPTTPSSASAASTTLSCSVSTILRLP